MKCRKQWWKQVRFVVAAFVFLGVAVAAMFWQGFVAAAMAADAAPQQAAAQA